MNDKQLARNFKLTWTRLRRSRAWHWLRRGLLGTLVVLLILDAVGVLLTVRLAAVEWEQVITNGFPSGPPRTVLSLAVGLDGERLFAGTEDGEVFRSDNGGETWRTVNQGLSPLDVLALGPDGERLFAGTWGDGVYRSDDGGASWRAVNVGLTNLDVLSLALGSDGERLFRSEGRRGGKDCSARGAP